MIRRTILRPALAIVALVALAALLLTAMGRPLICACGRVELWHGTVDSGNSQHLFDWYSPSHVIHGFLFYLAGWWLLGRRPVGWRLALAALVEAAWELAENSPAVIDRYRTATIALGYTGDSVVNSLADIACMIVGFLLARRLPVAATIAIGLAFELVTLWVIRDNLSLNVLMLLWPVEAIRQWQAS